MSIDMQPADSIEDLRPRVDQMKNADLNHDQ